MYITDPYYISTPIPAPCLNQTVIKPTDYKSATTIPATPSTPGSAVAKAPESVTLLATELAAEAALLLALLAALVADETPLLADELPLLEPEELESLVLEALEPEEVEELPPVMLLRMEPVWLLILVYGKDEGHGGLTWGCGGAGEDGAFEKVS